MKNLYKVLVISMAMLIAMPVFADSATNQFASCMVDNLNGKERKNLAKWIFFAIAAHPDIKSYSKASAKDINSSDQYVGKLITRLLTVNCPQQLKKANATDPMALKKAFGLVGRVAMQELMTNQNVTKALTNYAKYADHEKINKLLSQK